MTESSFQPTFLERLTRRTRTALVYVLAFHIVRITTDLLIPNSYIGNRIRGALFAPFFAKCGKRFALASGSIINSAWNMQIGDDVYIAHNCWINAAGGLSIGNGAIISPSVVIATTAHGRENGRVSLRKSHQAPISIGEGTWIASQTVLVKGCSIGSGTVIGAGSVVTGQIGSNALYAGSPLRLIKEFP